MSILGLFWLDWISFWIGFTVAAVAAFLLFRAQKRMASFTEAMSESYRTAVEAMTSTAAQGYRADLLRWAQSAHMAPHLFALEEILQPPRFLIPPVTIEPGQVAEYDAPTLFPFTPEWPQLAEAYGAPSIPLDQILRARAHILLAGVPGSGRTVALAAYALEWLKRTGGSGNQAADLPRSVFYVNAHDLSFSALAKDLLAPLAPAIQHYASTLSASQIPGYVRGSMRSEGCVLLLDAVDELPYPAQAEVRKWLQALMRQFSKTRIIATIAPEEIANWRPLGFALASPAPWSRAEKHSFLDRWGTRWQELVSAERKGQEPADPSLLIGWVSRHTEGLSPLDITLRAWAAFSGDMHGNSAAAGQESYLSRIAPTVAAEGMGGLVRSMIADDFAAPTRRQVENALALVWPHSETPLPPVEDVVDEMLTCGMLRRRPGNRVSFCHMSIAACFGAHVAGEEENLNNFFSASHSPLAEWTAQALATQADIATLVSARLAALSQKDDESGIPPVVEEGWKILRLARWLRDAPAGAGWKVEILRRLMKILRTPSQPYPLRARALCAFINSGDTSAIQLFRQILTSLEADTDGRVLCALGLGAMPDTGSVEILTKLLDSDLRELRWAGALALGYIASPATMETLGHTLLTGEDDLRRAAAEAMALDFVEGHPMLREAIQDAEVLVRRAAVFGLGKTAQPWVLEILEKLQVEDAQWAVKSAAGQAVERLHGEANIPFSAPPAPSELPWLVAFAAQRKTGLAPGAPAIAMLQRVIREGTVLERGAAVQALSALGDAKFLTDFCHGLGDNEPVVRNAAFEGLWDLENIRLSNPKA